MLELITLVWVVVVMVKTWHLGFFTMLLCGVGAYIVGSISEVIALWIWMPSSKETKKK